MGGWGGRAGGGWGHVVFSCLVLFFVSFFVCVCVCFSGTTFDSFTVVLRLYNTTVSVSFGCAARRWLLTIVTADARSNGRSTELFSLQQYSATVPNVSESCFFSFSCLVLSFLFSFVRVA